MVTFGYLYYFTYFKSFKYNKKQTKPCLSKYVRRKKEKRS